VWHVVPWGVGEYFSASVHNERVVALKQCSAWTSVSVCL
jgi:hypothetical protein